MPQLPNGAPLERTATEAPRLAHAIAVLIFGQVPLILRKAANLFLNASNNALTEAQPTMSDRQKRSHKQINYNEKAPSVGGAPAWVKLQHSQPELGSSQLSSQGKENSKDPSANQLPAEGTQAKKQAKPATASGKAAKVICTLLCNI